MGRLRHLSIALAALVLLSAVGTGAFSSASADRQVTVAVAEDDRALIGVESDGVELDNGAHIGDNETQEGQSRGGGTRQTVTLLRLTNRFQEPVTEVDVELIGGDHRTPPNLGTGGLSDFETIVVGESAAVTADVVCSNAAGNEETWTLRVEASGESFSVETTERVTVTCTGSPPANTGGATTGR